MSQGRFAILDPAAGISGDMLLGALIGAGAPPEWLKALPERLGHPGVTVEIAETDRASLRCTQVTVRLPDGRSEGPGDATAVQHQHGGHGHSHSHGAAAHRHIGGLIAEIERAPLSAWVKERAVRAFRLLGQAEGRVHGMRPEDVALHEVGAVDALIDIVGGIEGFERIGISRIFNRPVALGEGWINAAHGALPVPAPATAMLLEGLQVGPNGPVTGEATTPTGAVLLKVLSEGAPPTSWRPVASSWGAGGRNPGTYANALRLIVAEQVTEAAEIVVLATDIDDMSPEYLEPLREAAVSAGALDVQIWATQMKKGRTGFRVEALARPADAERVTEAVFRNSTTAGIRQWRAERSTLARRTIDVPAEDGTAVRVKVLDTPEGSRLKPEFDDVTAVARRIGRPALDVAGDVHRQAVRLAAAAVAGHDIPNTES
jgi:pyridinium-3,5-bisthiocarboxylic acid mononucleotide nickel chelatase